MEITWRDKTITCEEGTTLFDISKQVEKEYEFPWQFLPSVRKTN
jgi:uridine kinase